MAAADMLRIDAERPSATGFAEILPPRFMLALGAPFGGDGAPSRGNDPGLRDGRAIWPDVDTSISSIGSRRCATRWGTVGYVLVLEDHTEREELERERRKATADREQIQKIFEHYMPPAVFQELLRQGPEQRDRSGEPVS